MGNVLVLLVSACRDRPAVRLYWNVWVTLACITLLVALSPVLSLVWFLHAVLDYSVPRIKVGPV